MYKKVLISEDIDTINLAIQLTLFQLMITDMQHVKYCDDAVIKVKKAIHDNEPFDLFITDLSFEKDTRSVKLTSGEQAIAEIRKIQPNIKVIVYSVEDKKHRIKELYSKYNINAYVHKNRNSIEQLKIAITKTFQAETAYISPELQHLLEDKTNLHIDQIDIKILEQLALGLTHEEIATILKQQNTIPSSKSAIEKKSKQTQRLLQSQQYHSPHSHHKRFRHHLKKN